MNKLKRIFCVIFGHSKIVDTCFGYIHCARCDEQIGDTLAGMFDLTDYVLKGHNCKTCRENYKKLTWKDKFMVGDPFTEE